MPANWKIQHLPQDWKKSVLIPIRKKGNAKEYLNYPTIAFISYTSKVINAQNSPSQVSTVCELPEVQAGFRKVRGTRDQIANISWIIEKAREFQKNITSALLTTPNPLTMWLTINCGKFLKR